MYHSLNFRTWIHSDDKALIIHKCEIKYHTNSIHYTCLSFLPLPIGMHCHISGQCFHSLSESTCVHTSITQTTIVFMYGQHISGGYGMAKSHPDDKVWSVLTKYKQKSQQQAQLLAWVKRLTQVSAKSTQVMHTT